MKVDLIDQPGVKPFLDLVAECMDRAWARLKGDTPVHNWADLTSRSKASMFHDYFMSEMQTASLDVDGVECEEDRQLRSIVTSFAEFRFKKFGKGFGKLSLNKSRRTNQWVNLPLPGDLAALDKLFLGYTVGQKWGIPQELAIVQVVGRTPVDLLIVPFEESIPDSEPAPIQLEPRFRLNYTAARRERQSAMQWSSDGESQATGS